MTAAINSSQPSKMLMKQTFLELYRRKPLSQITVREICDACSLSRTTFYFYFEDINELYYDCVQDAINYMEKDLSGIVLFTVGRDFNRYVEAYNKHLTVLKENSELYRILLQGSENISFREHWFQSIYNHFSQTLSFSKKVDSQLRDSLIRFFAGGQLNILTSWVLSGCKIPVNTISYTSAQALFFGVYGNNI
ncbi:MAG: TetR/AcrR family transcriptional regulator [Lachnospiraceae bacterium]|jgi:AcrR family transcriptional regulator